MTVAAVPLVVRTPVRGTSVGLPAVGDPVFAEAMVGPGTAVDPDRAAGEAVAPISGQIATLHPHAFVVVDAEGRGVLVHLGVDTVELKGEGFELAAARGEDVQAGQPLVRWNPAAVEGGGRSPLCPVVALDASPDQLTDVVTAGPVREGDALFSWR